MNGILLAVIAAVALLVAVLLLKKRSSQNKTSQIEPVDSVEKTTTSAETTPGPIDDSPAEAEAGQTLETQAGPVSEEEPGSPLHMEAEPIEAEPISEPVVFDLEEDTPLADFEDELLVGDAEKSQTPILEEVVVRLEEAPVGSEAAEPVPLELEEVPGQGLGQFEESREQVVPVEAEASVMVVESEEESVGAAVVAATEIAAPEKAEDIAVMAEALPRVRLTMEAYSARLNDLEEKQRALLAQAIRQREDKKRDQLQRELVIMNDKLALLADSYAEEKECYEHVLVALESLHGKADAAELETAVQGLEEGEPQPAERFLAQLSEQQHPFAAQAAFYSGQLAACRVDLQKALDLFRHAVELDPENPLYLQAAGKTACRVYRYKDALSWLESFVKLSSETKDTEPVAFALAQRDLAYTYVLSGQYQKAGPLYKESMTVLSKTLGQDHPEMATSWSQLGELQETLGEYDKAVSLYKKSLQILEEKRGQDHPVLAGILDKLAALCMELEMEKQAVPLYQRLVQIREKALRPTHPQLALSLNNLAESYRLQGQYAEAEACYRKSLTINETIHGAEHPSVAAVLQELAKLCNSQRKPEEAQQYQERASVIFQKSVEASEKKSGKEALTLEI